MSPVWIDDSVPLRSSYSARASLVLKDAPAAVIHALGFTMNSSGKEYDVPRKNGVRCEGCNMVIKEIPGGWAHKNKKHWVDNPHKARPARTHAA
jgi:hypothetical protein